MRRAESGTVAWGAWYRARFLRLYPMYWVAHLVYLLSPFIARLEPVDSRIILSLLGLRFIDIQMNLMYLNAAWWYFSMLIQFIFMFPLLFWASLRWAALSRRLCACRMTSFCHGRLNRMQKTPAMPQPQATSAVIIKKMCESRRWDHQLQRDRHERQGRDHQQHDSRGKG